MLKGQNVERTECQKDRLSKRTKCQQDRLPKKGRMSKGQNVKRAECRKDRIMKGQNDARIEYVEGLIVTDGEGEECVDPGGNGAILGNGLLASDSGGG
jgi:hypothetical protein